jgi:hypothetical protein
MGKRVSQNRVFGEAGRAAEAVSYSNFTEQIEVK